MVAEDGDCLSSSVVANDNVTTIVAAQPAATLNETNKKEVELAEDHRQKSTATTAIMGMVASDTDFFYYFSFGSNLLRERIHVQIKGARFETIGLLKDHELAFFDASRRCENRPLLRQGALASIEPKVGSEVYGCVWRVSNAYAAELDRQESVYQRLEVPIHVDSVAHSTTTALGANILRCRTYQYASASRVRRAPSPHYKHVIVSGAVQHSLPSDYIHRLRAIEDNGYRGRVKLELEVLAELNHKHQHSNLEDSDEDDVICVHSTNTRNSSSNDEK